MFACLLLDPFQQCLGMSVMFGLSICTVSAENCSVETVSVLLILGGKGGIYN